MIRTSLLMMFVAFFSVYAWKNWFVSLCSTVLLLSVLEHPDFPNSIGGIQGANPWNILLLSVVAAWAVKRGEDGHPWDLPGPASALLLAGLVTIVTGVVRLTLNDYPSGMTTGYILSEHLLNTVKWVVPGLLLFDACRTRRRTIIALGVILALYLLLAVQVIRWMPLSEAGAGVDLANRASKITQNEIGYNRVTLSMMLAGASWASLAIIPVFKRCLHRVMLVGAAGTIALGQALTGGRTGYVTWILVGVALAALKWRKLLLFIPLAVLMVGALLPGVRERMLQGFGGKDGNFTAGASAYEMTSGRDIAWPVVIEEISKAPLLGHGREAMITTGIKDNLWSDYQESFPHPHQAYLQLLLDNGIIGMLLIMPVFLFALRHSLKQALVQYDPLIAAVGCTALCLVLALMIGGFGGQTFYPREGAVGMWAAIGLMLRIQVNSKLSVETADPVFPDLLTEHLFVNVVEEPPADVEPAGNPQRTPAI